MYLKISAILSRGRWVKQQDTLLEQHGAVVGRLADGCVAFKWKIPDSKVHGANIWGRQDPGGLHVGSMILAIWDALPEDKGSH